jgi:hypothetical protein
MEQPEQGFKPTSKHHHGNPEGAPGIGNRGTNLRELGGVVLVDMVKTLERWKEEIPRRNLGRIIVSKTRGDDRSQIRTRDLEFRQERKRLSNCNPRNRRR